MKLTIEQFNRLLYILDVIDFSPFIGGIKQYKEKPDYIIVQTSYSITRGGSDLETEYPILLLALKSDLTVKLYRDYLKVMNTNIKWLQRDLTIYNSSLNVHNKSKERYSRLLDKSRKDEELAQDEDYFLKAYQTEVESIKILQNKVRKASIDIENYINKSSPWVLFEENERKKKKGIPCRKCGTYDNVSAYSVKDEHGGGFKCIPYFCPTCLTIAHQNNPMYIYTKLGDN